VLWGAVTPAEKWRRHPVRGQVPTPKGRFPPFLNTNTPALEHGGDKLTKVSATTSAVCSLGVAITAYRAVSIRGRRV